VSWFFTVVLIGISVATLVFTGYLLRSVLTIETIEPVVPPAADEGNTP
jgi:hypothetical protein